MMKGRALVKLDTLDDTKPLSSIEVGDVYGFMELLGFTGFIILLCLLSVLDLMSKSLILLVRWMVTWELFNWINFENNQKR